jgi:hypothetical protein
MADEIRTRRVFRLFGAWQDEREESWLRAMAQQGWHLRRAGFPVYTFSSGAAVDAVYRMDYQVLAKRDRAEYEGIFRSAGWEHVCDLSNWHYFRTPASAGSDPDIFSDVESRAAKYRRMLGVLIVFLPIMSVGVSRMLRLESGESPTGLLVFLTIVWVLLALIWCYAIVRIMLRIRKLKVGVKK